MTIVLVVNVIVVQRVAIGMSGMDQEFGTGWNVACAGSD